MNLKFPDTCELKIWYIIIFMSNYAISSKYLNLISSKKLEIAMIQVETLNIFFKNVHFHLTSLRRQHLCLAIIETIQFCEL